MPIDCDNTPKVTFDRDDTTSELNRLVTILPGRFVAYGGVYNRSENWNKTLNASTGTVVQSPPLNFYI